MCVNLREVILGSLSSRAGRTGCQCLVGGVPGQGEPGPGRSKENHSWGGEAPGRDRPPPPPDSSVRAHPHCPLLTEAQQEQLIYQPSHCPLGELQGHKAPRGVCWQCVDLIALLPGGPGGWAWQLAKAKVVGCNCRSPQAEGGASRKLQGDSSEGALGSPKQGGGGVASQRLQGGVREAEGKTGPSMRIAEETGQQSATGQPLWLPLSGTVPPRSRGG